MANTANSSWKLTTLDNTALWTADTNEPPDNYNQQVSVAYDKIDRPRDDQDNWMSWGLDGRSISIQGVATYDKDVWKLSSAVNGRKLMKWWGGEDYFCYVLGQSATVVRDQRLPTYASYTVSLIGVDPFWYWSNSAAGSGSGVDWVVPYSYENDGWSTEDIIIDLTGTGADEATSYVEPCFWVTGGASTAITQLDITDEGGRTLEIKFQDTVGNGETFVILPWNVRSLEGYVIIDSCVVKDTGSSLTAPTGDFTPTAGDEANSGTWALDGFNLDSNFEYIDSPAPKACVNSQVTTKLKKIKSYPRAEDGLENKFDLSATGTTTDAKVFAQWLHRRL